MQSPSVVHGQGPQVPSLPQHSPARHSSFDPHGQSPHLPSLPQH